MNVFFSVSSRKNIDSEYFNDAKKISDILAKAGYDLVIGAAMKDGMSGEVLKRIKNHNRKIYLKTMESYHEDPKEFYYVDFEYVEDTFMRTKHIYDESDILFFMPGGTGTTAEIFAFLEQLRTDKCSKRIVIYNKDNYYQDILKAIHKYVSLNFNDDSIFEYLNIYNDEEELINFITKYQNDYINNKII